MTKNLNTALRTICVILMLLAAVFFGSAAAGADVAQAEEEKASAPQAAAEAELMQLQLGSSGYAMSVPNAYRNGEVTI